MKCNPSNLKVNKKIVNRCLCASTSKFNTYYHDNEWGSPISNSHKLFEILSLCTQQAGISWKIVWNKRDAYRQAFYNFDMERVSNMNDDDIDSLISNASSKIIRNRRKLLAIINNAKICLDIHKTCTLSNFLWGFLPNNEPVVNTLLWTSNHSPPNETKYSKAMAKELKKLGFKFLGSITLNAFLQQCGMLNDHCITCYKNPLHELKTSSCIP